MRICGLLLAVFVVVEVGWAGLNWAQNGARCAVMPTLELKSLRAIFVSSLQIGTLLACQYHARQSILRAEPAAPVAVGNDGEDLIAWQR